jgi:hypothetical protein
MKFLLLNSNSPRDFPCELNKEIPSDKSCSPILITSRNDPDDSLRRNCARDWCDYYIIQHNSNTRLEESQGSIIQTRQEPYFQESRALKDTDKIVSESRRFWPMSPTHNDIDFHLNSTHWIITHENHHQEVLSSFKTARFSKSLMIRWIASGWDTTIALVQVMISRPPEKPYKGVYWLTVSVRVNWLNYNCFHDMKPLNEFISLIATCFDLNSWTMSTWRLYKHVGLLSLFTSEAFSGRKYFPWTDSSQLRNSRYDIDNRMAGNRLLLPTINFYHREYIAISTESF